MICVSGLWQRYPAVSRMCRPDSGPGAVGGKRTCRDVGFQEEAVSTSHRWVADLIQEMKTSGIRNQPK